MENNTCGGKVCCNKSSMMGCGEMFCVRSLIKMILTLFIVVFIFSMGVKFGELKASVMGNQSYGRHMMMQDFDGEYGGAMMGGNTMMKAEATKVTPTTKK